MGVVDEVLLSLQTTIGVVLPFRRIWGFWSLPNLSANCWPPLATQKHFTNMLTVSVYWNYALPRAAQTFFNRSSIFGWHSAEPEKKTGCTWVAPQIFNYLATSLNHPRKKKQTRGLLVSSWLEVLQRVSHWWKRAVCNLLHCTDCSR